MTDIYLSLACAYANLFMGADMDRCMDVVQELNTTLRNDYICFDVYYNQGAARLVAGRLDEARELLYESVKLCRMLKVGGLRYAMALQKLAFALAFLGYAEATDITAQLKSYLRCNGLHESHNITVINASVNVLEYIAVNPNYLQSEDYCNLLRECYDYATKTEHKGQEMFFGRFLVDAYKACRKYKKALEISEKIRLSF